jgi:hypothetical protein
MADSALIQPKSSINGSKSNPSKQRERKLPRGDLDYYLQLTRQIVENSHPPPEEGKIPKRKIRPAISQSITRNRQISVGKTTITEGNNSTEPSVIESTEHDDLSDEELLRTDLNKIRLHSAKDFRKCWTSGDLFYGTTSSATRSYQLMQEEPIRFRSVEFDHVDMLEKYRHFQWYDQIREDTKKATDNAKEKEKKKVHFS